MSKIKSLTVLGTTCLWAALVATVPLSARAQQDQTQPEAQQEEAQQGTQMTAEQETEAVTTVSDLLANKVTSDSCSDFKTMVGKLSSGGDTPVDPTTSVGQVLTAVKAKPALQTIVVDKVGPPLISKLLECDLITPDVLIP